MYLLYMSCLSFIFLRTHTWSFANPKTYIFSLQFQKIWEKRFLFTCCLFSGLYLCQILMRKRIPNFPLGLVQIWLILTFLHVNAIQFTHRLSTLNFLGSHINLTHCKYLPSTSHPDFRKLSNYIKMLCLSLICHASPLYFSGHTHGPLQILKDAFSRFSFRK